MLIRLLSLIIAILFTASCSGNVRQTLGIAKEAPDEFKVVSSLPLTLPPDFSLRPPVAGSKRPQKTDIEKQAQQVLFEKTSADLVIEEEGGESVLLGLIGTDSANPDIRKLLEEDERKEQEIKKEKNIFDKVLGYTKIKSEDEEPVVHASKEKKRIIENKKEGKPITGEETPVVENDKEGIINNIFGL